MEISIAPRPSIGRRDARNTRDSVGHFRARSVGLGRLALSRVVSLRQASIAFVSCVPVRVAGQRENVTIQKVGRPAVENSRSPVTVSKRSKESRAVSGASMCTVVRVSGSTRS